MVPSVSVIIPTYNRSDLVGEAVESVLAQTFTDFEIIVIDDGSTDDTAEVMRKFSDFRVVYVAQANRGRSQARNTAYQLSRGRYIAFLDSDDLYVPEKLAIQVDYLDNHPDVGMVYTSASCIDRSGKVLKGNYIASVSGRIYKSIAFFLPVTITLPTVMLRRELIETVGGFDENMSRFEDTDMWRRISKITTIDGMPEFTCKLRTHGDNCLQAQDPVNIMSSLDYYAKKVWREDVALGNWLLRRGLGGLYYYYGAAFLTVPEWRGKGYSLIKTAFSYWPFYAIKYALRRAYAMLRRAYTMLSSKSATG